MSPARRPVMDREQAEAEYRSTLDEFGGGGLPAKVHNRLFDQNHAAYLVLRSTPEGQAFINSSSVTRCRAPGWEQPLTSSSGTRGPPARCSKRSPTAGWMRSTS